MKFFLFVLLFVLDSVHSDVCLLDEPEPDCEGYCYTSVKPILSYIPSLQKRLEACEALNPKSYGEDELDDIKDQLAVQLKLNELWATRFDECQNVLQKQNTFFDVYDQKLSATESNLKDMEEQLRKQVEKVETCESNAKASEIILNDQRNLVRKYESGRNNFTKLGDKYYYIEHNETQSWLGALQKCAQWGGHLANLQSDEEWNNLKNKLLHGHDYWLDINDIEEEGIFRSATTGQLTRSSKWNKGEPNNSAWTTKTEENCVELRSQYDFNLNDRTCIHGINFVCEI